jgi:hypothetical protein
MADVLATQWAAITAANPGFTTDQKLAVLNATMVAGPNVDVPVATAMLYLANAGKWAALLVYAQKAYATLQAGGTLTAAQTAAAQLAALIAVPQFTAFSTSTSAGYTACKTMLNAVASDSASGLSAADVTTLLGFAATVQPWWQANGFIGPITTAHLTAESPKLT